MQIGIKHYQKRLDSLIVHILFSWFLNVWEKKVVTGLIWKIFHGRIWNTGKKKDGGSGGPFRGLLWGRQGPQSGKIVEYDPSNEVFLLHSLWSFSFAVFISSFWGGERKKMIRAPGAPGWGPWMGSLDGVPKGLRVTLKLIRISLLFTFEVG